MRTLDWDWMYLTLQMIAESAEEQSRLVEDPSDKLSLTKLSVHAWGGRRFIADAIRNRKPEEPATEVIF